MKNYYKTLGLPVDSSQEDIQEAYDRLSKELDPKNNDNQEFFIKEYKKLQDVIDKKYPNISYIICFIIPNQPNTQYYKHLDNRTFLFTLNDTSYDNNNLSLLLYLKLKSLESKTLTMVSICLETSSLMLSS